MSINEPAGTELSVSTGNQPAVKQPAEAALDRAMQAIFGAGAGRELNNFDGDARNKWRLMSLCGGSSAEPLQENCDKLLDVVYYSGSIYEAEDSNTGEIEERLRLVLVTQDGKAYSTGSPYVAREIGRAVSLFGNVPFDPPLRVKCVKVKGKHPSPFLTLQACE